MQPSGQCYSSRSHQLLPGLLCHAPVSKLTHKRVTPSPVVPLLVAPSVAAPSLGAVGGSRVVLRVVLTQDGSQGRSRPPAHGDQILTAGFSFHRQSFYDMLLNKYESQTW